MKKKRSSQKKTPPTQELKIVALERSSQQQEPPQEQPTAPLLEKPVENAASASEKETPPPDEPTPKKPVENAASASEKETPSPDESAPAQSASSDESDEPSAFFQAVGILPGDISFEEERTFVSLGDKTYRLYYCNSRKRAYYALKKEIEATGITQQRLIVYPKVTHFPGGKQPYQVAFQLVGFITPHVPGEGVESALTDWEFKIAGLWQLIPVCRIPCISVFRNFNQERLEFIKSAQLEKKVNFMKAAHLPVLWPEAQFAPFRFNPKLEKEAQGKASFVEIKARFNSERNLFEFQSLLAAPSSEAPRYLKAGKKDKHQVAKARLAASKARSHSSSPANDSKAPPKRRKKPKPSEVAQS